MANHLHKDGPLEARSIKYPKSFLDGVDALNAGEEGNQSDGIRAVAQFGLRALQRPGALQALDLEHQVQELRRIAAAWPDAKTPAGSYWAQSTDQLPTDARALRPSVSVVPGGLILAGVPGSGLVTADMETETLRFSAPDGKRWETPLDLIALAALAPSVAVGLHRLAAGPGQVQLPGQITMERLDSGDIRLAGGGIEVTTSGLAAYRWSAELAALLAASMVPRLARRECLEQQIERPMEVAK